MEKRGVAVGVRIHPANRVRTLVVKDRARSSGRNRWIGAGFVDKRRRGNKRGITVGEAGIEASLRFVRVEFGAGAAINGGRLRVELAVVFAVPRLVELDFLVKRFFAEEREKMNAPTVSRKFGVGDESIAERHFVIFAQKTVGRVGEGAQRVFRRRERRFRLRGRSRFFGFLG